MQNTNNNINQRKTRGPILSMSDPQQCNQQELQLQNIFNICPENYPEEIPTLQINVSEASNAECSSYLPSHNFQALQTVNPYDVAEKLKQCNVAPSTVDKGVNTDSQTMDNKDQQIQALEGIKFELSQALTDANFTSEVKTHIISAKDETINRLERELMKLRNALLESQNNLNSANQENQLLKQNLQAKQQGNMQNPYNQRPSTSSAPRGEQWSRQQLDSGATFQL